MATYDLCFSSSSSSEAGSFKLLELPPDLCKLIESAVDGPNPSSLSVKGHSEGDAVLCTTDKTYALRSVVLSNSILVVTAPPPGTDSQIVAARPVVIRDQLNEVIELIPSLPKIHKLSGLLKGMEYDDTQEDICSDNDNDDEPDRPVKRRRFTYQDAQSEIEASDAELARGIKERRILSINGQLRPIQPNYLTTILELLLNYIVSFSLPPDEAPAEELIHALGDQHEISKQVVTQVMSWFGDVQAGLWCVDVKAVLKEIGLGLLREHKHDPLSEGKFVAKWRAAVGDTFASSISLSLLSGNYILTPSLTCEVPEQVLTYFPTSALPFDPAARFADLFLTRSRWKEDEITPFLADIAVNAKERDKLLLKFARATTDSNGIWYTARSG